MTCYEFIENKIRTGTRDGSAMVQGQMHRHIGKCGVTAGGYYATHGLTDGDVSRLGAVVVSLSLNPRQGLREWFGAVEIGKRTPLYWHGDGGTAETAADREARKRAEARLREYAERRRRYAHYVRGLIQRGGSTATFDDLRRLCCVREDNEPREMAIDFLMRLFAEGEYIFASNDERDGRVRIVEDVLDEIYKGAQIPQYTIINPFTGSTAPTKRGDRMSYRCDAAVSTCRHFLLECDGFTDVDNVAHPLALEVQAAMWRGIILSGALDVVSIVYTGGKSLHGIVRTGIQAEADGGKGWDEFAEAVRLRFRSDENPLYHVDGACFNRSRLTRMAGAWREDKGRRQELLYLS